MATASPKPSLPPRPTPQPKPVRGAAAPKATPHHAPVKREDPRVLGLRWTGRVLGAIVALGLVAVAVTQRWPVVSPMALALGVTVLGLALAWRWESVGAVTAIAGLILLFAMNWFTGSLPAGLFPVLAAPAALAFAAEMMGQRGGELDD